MPTVSVIMPCYNHSKYLVEGIESILNQSYEDFELIITDDCSKDNSQEIIKNYERTDKRVKGCYHNVNSGEAKSRNDAMAISTGDYIAFCDSDDVWEKDKLKTQLFYLNKYQDHAVVHSDSIIIDEDSKPTGKRFSGMYQKGMKLTGDLFQQLCMKNFINVPTVIIRRKCLSDGGLFEEDFKYLTDWIYWVRVSRRNSFFYINEPLAQYRIHSGSTLHDIQGFTFHMIKGYTLILKMFPDISDTVKSRIFYTLGMQYRWLKEKKTAKNFFLKTIRCDPFYLRGYFRLIFL